MREFRPGQKVRLVRRMGNWPGGWVSYIMDPMIGKVFTVQQVRLLSDAIPRMILCGREANCFFPPEAFDPVMVDINIKRPVRTRSGQLVRVRRDITDPERPLRADITMLDGKVRTLSYPVNGYFYEYFEQPFDLVNE